MTGPGNEQVQELADWAEKLQQQARRYGELQDQLSNTSVTETSANGGVRITVDSNGVPTELTVTDRAQGMSPAEITSALSQTLARAQARLRDRVSELASSVVGDDEPANNIVQGYKNRFPDPVDQERPHTPASDNTIGLDDFDDHWGDSNSFRR